MPLNLTIHVPALGSALELLAADDERVDSLLLRARTLLDPQLDDAHFDSAFLALSDSAPPLLASRRVAELLPLDCSTAALFLRTSAIDVVHRVDELASSTLSLRNDVALLELRNQKLPASLRLQHSPSSGRALGSAGGATLLWDRIQQQQDEPSQSSVALATDAAATSLSTTTATATTTTEPPPPPLPPPPTATSSVDEPTSSLSVVVPALSRYLESSVPATVAEAVNADRETYRRVFTSSDAVVADERSESGSTTAADNERWNDLEKLSLQEPPVEVEFEQMLHCSIRAAETGVVDDGVSETSLLDAESSAASAPSLPPTPTNNSDFGDILPFIDQYIVAHRTPSREATWQQTTRKRAAPRSPRTNTITIGARPAAAAAAAAAVQQHHNVPPPLPEKTDEVRQAMLLSSSAASSPAVLTTTPTTTTITTTTTTSAPDAAAPAAPVPTKSGPAGFALDGRSTSHPRHSTSKLSSLKRTLQRATLGLTLTAHPTLRRLHRARHRNDEHSSNSASNYSADDNDDSATTADENSATNDDDYAAPSSAGKSVHPKYRLPLLTRYRDRIRRALVRTAVELTTIESDVARAERDETLLGGLLERFAPTTLLGARVAPSAALDAAAVRVAVSPMLLSAIALVPAQFWARRDEARHATLRDAPCVLLARRSAQLVRCNALATRAAQHLYTLRAVALRGKLAVVDARIARLSAAEQAQRLPPSADPAVTSPLTDDFFESPQRIEQRDDRIMDAVGSATLLRSEMEAARALYVERCVAVQRLSDAQRAGVVRRDVAALLAREVAPHDASADEFDAVLRDRRTPHGRQLDRLCALVAPDSGAENADLRPHDVVGFLEQFVGALAQRYELSAERLPLLATLVARCVAPMIARDCGALLLPRVPAAATTMRLGERFVRGCGMWRARAGEALGVDERLWAGLVQCQEARVAAGVLSDNNSNSSGNEHDACLLPDALALLQTLDDVAAASDMLRVLQSTVAAICERAAVALGPGQAVGADALFPLVIHVLAHAQLAAMPTLVAFMQEFAAESELVSELGYCLTTVSAAVQCIAETE